MVLSARNLLSRLVLIQDGQPAVPSAAAPVRPKPKRRRWPFWYLTILAILAITALAGWAAREAITAKGESAIIERLTEAAIYLHYARSLWSPWSGLRLEDVVLHRDAEGGHPVVAVSVLSADFSWWRSLTSRALISRWRTKDATLKLYDGAGIVTFEHLLPYHESDHVGRAIPSRWCDDYPRRGHRGTF